MIVLPLLLLCMCAMGVASRGVGHFLQFTGGSVDDEMNSGIGHKRSSDSGIQFMITNKMRATLRKDLGYQDDEIDDMKPEVAAVVIERALIRPKKGMPVRWRKSSEGGIVSKVLRQFQPTRQLKRMYKGIVKGVQQTGDFLVEQSQQPVLRVIGGAIALWLIKDPILQNAEVAWQIVAAKLKEWLPGRQKLTSYQLTPQYHKRSLKSVLEGPHPGGFVHRKGGWRGWLGRRTGNHRESGSSGSSNRNWRGGVDVDALSMVQERSVWEKAGAGLRRWTKGGQ